MKLYIALVGADPGFSGVMEKALGLVPKPRWACRDGQEVKATPEIIRLLERCKINSGDEDARIHFYSGDFVTPRGWVLTKKGSILGRESAESSPYISMSPARTIPMRFPI